MGSARTSRTGIRACSKGSKRICEAGSLHDLTQLPVCSRKILCPVAGSWKPLPAQEFEGLEKGIESLQFLQRAQHIGKVVLTVPGRMKLSPDASYVLSGGMGALGLVTAQALAEEGAKSLLLLSRSGRPGAEVEQQWKWLQQSSLQACALACDVASQAGAMELKKRFKSAEPTGKGKKPVRGLLHLAGVPDSARVIPCHVSSCLAALLLL